MVRRNPMKQSAASYRTNVLHELKTNTGQYLEIYAVKMLTVYTLIGREARE